MGEVNLPPHVGALIADLQARLAELERRGVRFPTYTTATRPAATTVQIGAPIFVSDAVDGSRFQASDGSNWKVLG